MPGNAAIVAFEGTGPGSAERQPRRRCSGHEKSPAARCAAGGQTDDMGNLGAGAPRIFGGGGKNEGVGEHVRTRFHFNLRSNGDFETAGEIADH